MSFVKRIGRPTGRSGTAPSRFVVLSVIVATLAMLGAGVAAAGAKPKSSAKPKLSGPVSAEMKIVAFDPAVAARYGYEIRTAPDGREYSVKRDASARVLPQSAGGGEVTGDCGTSRVRINGIGNLSDQLDTSWSVYAPVIGFTWNISIIDSGGVTVQSWGPRPGPGSPGWSDSRTLTNMTPGPIDAQVSTDSSVLLITGAVCYSGGPRDDSVTY
jgi:hypothetical protein